jgi:hypothetical protein
MKTTLDRITTEFVDAEDRIRLSGEVASQGAVVVWLTQRLLNRLLPVLFQKLEGTQDDVWRSAVRQAFAQQVAQADIRSQAPVMVDSSVHSWLATSIDIATGAELVVLTFKGGPGQVTSLTLLITQLRQWLAIVYQAYVIADWPLHGWPNWLAESAPMPATQLVLH